MEIQDILKTFPKIGSDEVGKGDFFGPLVVCAVYVDDPSRLKAYASGDSKTLSDFRIMQSAPEMIKNLVHSVVKISPEKYNELYSRFKNINIILGWAHAQAIKNVLEKKINPEIILIDKFGPEFRILKHFDDCDLKKKMVFRTKAEMDIAVAAASVIARYIFLIDMGELGRECGLDLPLGAGNSVDSAAKKLAEKVGLQKLSRYVKTHFKNYSRLR